MICSIQSCKLWLGQSYNFMKWKEIILHANTVIKFQGSLTILSKVFQISDFFLKRQTDCWLSFPWKYFFLLSSIFWRYSGPLRIVFFLLRQTRCCFSACKSTYDRNYVEVTTFLLFQSTVFNVKKQLSASQTKRQNEMVNIAAI